MPSFSRSQVAPHRARPRRPSAHPDSQALAPLRLTRGKKVVAAVRAPVKRAARNSQMRPARRPDRDARNFEQAGSPSAVTAVAVPDVRETLSLLDVEHFQTTLSTKSVAAHTQPDAAGGTSPVARLLSGEPWTVIDLRSVTPHRTTNGHRAPYSGASRVQATGSPTMAWFGEEVTGVRVCGTDEFAVQ